MDSRPEKPDAVRRLALAQRAALVPLAVELLEPAGRAILLLAYRHGLSDAAIAARLKLDVTRIAQAREDQLLRVAAATGLSSSAAVVAGLDYVSFPGPVSASPAPAPAALPPAARGRHPGPLVVALGQRVPLGLIVLLSVVSVGVGLNRPAGQPEALPGGGDIAAAPEAVPAAPASPPADPSRGGGTSGSPGGAQGGGARRGGRGTHRVAAGGGSGTGGRGRAQRRGGARARRGAFGVAGVSAEGAGDQVVARGGGGTQPFRASGGGAHVQPPGGRSTPPGGVGTEAPPAPAVATDRHGPRHGHAHPGHPVRPADPPHPPHPSHPVHPPHPATPQSHQPPAPPAAPPEGSQHGNPHGEPPGQAGHADNGHGHGH